MTAADAAPSALSRRQPNSAPPGRRPSRRRSWGALATLGTELALIAVAVLDVLPWSGTHLSGNDELLAALSVAGFLFRRRWPLVTWLCGLPALVYSLLLITPLVTVYFAVRRTRYRAVIATVTGLTFLGYVWAALLQGIADAGHVAELQSVVSALVFAGAPAALALALRARHSLDLRLRQVVAMQTREQSLLTYTAVADERTRLAREMHDVVSHQVSLIALRAGALRMTTAEAASKDAAATIHRLASQTLDELRVMVGALRGPTDDLAPQPRLADIPALIDACGLSVRLIDELSEEPTWSTQAQRAIYRTVQEGLTNVRKHAPGASVVVRLSSHGQKLFVLVRDSGAARPAGSPTSDQAVAAPLPIGGHGLLGLRERAELLDGQLATSRNSDGGFDLRMEICDPRA